MKVKGKKEKSYNFFIKQLIHVTESSKESTRAGSEEMFVSTLTITF